MPTARCSNSKNINTNVEIMKRLSTKSPKNPKIVHIIFFNKI